MYNIGVQLIKGANHKERIFRLLDSFYKYHNPNSIRMIVLTQELSKKELELFNDLHKKYNVDKDNLIIKHLPKLLPSLTQPKYELASLVPDKKEYIHFIDDDAFFINNVLNEFEQSQNLLEQAYKYVLISFINNNHRLGLFYSKEVGEFNLVNIDNMYKLEGYFIKCSDFIDLYNMHLQYITHLDDIGLMYSCIIENRLPLAKPTESLNKKETEKFHEDKYKVGHINVNTRYYELTSYLYPFKDIIQNNLNKLSSSVSNRITKHKLYNLKNKIEEFTNQFIKDYVDFEMKESKKSIHEIAKLSIELFKLKQKENINARNLDKIIEELNDDRFKNIN